AHRQDVGFPPSERRGQCEYFPEHSPGPVVDLVPQKGSNVEARQPAMTAVTRELNIRLRVRLFHLRGNCVDQRSRQSLRWIDSLLAAVSAKLNQTPREKRSNGHRFAGLLSIVFGERGEVVAVREPEARRVCATGHREQLGFELPDISVNIRGLYADLECLSALGASGQSIEPRAKKQFAQRKQERIAP